MSNFERKNQMSWWNKFKRYEVSVPIELNKKFEWCATMLKTTKEDVFQRALTLLAHAIEADEIILIGKDKDGNKTEKKVLLK